MNTIEKQRHSIQQLLLLFQQILFIYALVQKLILR